MQVAERARALSVAMTVAVAVAVAATTACGVAGAAPPATPPAGANPAIDAAAYLRVAAAATQHRAARRVDEATFVALAREPGTVILDARSREKYDELHIRGAVHLSFPDITVESLRRLLPDRNARILIYCNNNFTHADDAFPAKLPAAALNLATYVALYTYGYRNVYELGPLLDARTTRIEFAGSGAASGR